MVWSKPIKSYIEKFIEIRNEEVKLFQKFKNCKRSDIHILDDEKNELNKRKRILMNNYRQKIERVGNTKEY